MDETAVIDETVLTAAIILAKQFIHNGVSKRIEVLYKLQIRIRHCITTVIKPDDNCQRPLFSYTGLYHKTYNCHNLRIYELANKTGGFSIPSM
jgi:hypothetical protein